MFSGGKDSLLVLLKLKDQIDHINVVFVNTGKNFLEALNFIDTIKGMCPKFIELRSDREGNWATYGMPSDLIAPMNGKYQSVRTCCHSNIMMPVVHLVKALGSTILIRGNKIGDVIYDGVASGSMVEGVVIYNPIENLTDYQVIEALKTFDIVLPDYFSFEHTSLDCMDCTGYLGKTKDRLELLKTKYPFQYSITKKNIEKIIAISETTLDSIKKAIL